MKPCARCDVTKPLDDFNRGSLKDGRQSWCRACQQERQATYSKTAKGREVQRRSSRKMRLRKQYGLTEAQYEVMLAGQGGACAICRAKSADRKLCVDHDHETGEVRGLLCGTCNRAIGLLGDNLDGLMRAVSYLTAPLPIRRRTTTTHGAA